jgi:FkbM family methyltransferase
LKKDVIWIEALPSVYEELMCNIKDYANQKAFCALLGDRIEKDVKIFLSNNEYSASSIFDLHPKSEFKQVKIVDEILLPMTTLDSLLAKEICSNYNHWIVDVQGAELLVLKGSVQSLKYCNSIVVEVSNRPTYINGVSYIELKTFLIANGFIPLWDPKANEHTDIPFIRNDN